MKSALNKTKHALNNNLIIFGIILMFIAISCGKDDPEPVLKPSLMAWAEPDSVAYKGSSTVMLKAENAKAVQIGTFSVANRTSTFSVSYTNLLKDTSIVCSATGYNNQVVYDTVLIRVAA